MHKDYWVAISLYVAAAVLTGLPFFGVFQLALDLPYPLLKLLHLLTVIAVFCVLVGQLIAYNVMEHAGITTQRALQYLSLLDHSIPVALVVIGVLGHSMAAQIGPIWETPWVYESAFGLFAYTIGGLAVTCLFRKTGMNLDEDSRSSVGVYVGSGVGVVFLAYMTGVMVYKQAPFTTAIHFVEITRYFAGAP